AHLGGLPTGMRGRSRTAGEAFPFLASPSEPPQPAYGAACPIIDAPGWTVHAPECLTDYPLWRETAEKKREEAPPPDPLPIALERGRRKAGSPSPTRWGG